MSTAPMVSLPAHFHVASQKLEMAEIRIEGFENALKAYTKSKGNYWERGSNQSWLADMLADALHWSDVNGIDVDFVLKLARSHFESEKLEDVMRISKESKAAHQSAGSPH